MEFKAEVLVALWGAALRLAQAVSERGICWLQNAAATVRLASDGSRAGQALEPLGLQPREEERVIRVKRVSPSHPARGTRHAGNLALLRFVT